MNAIDAYHEFCDSVRDGSYAFPDNSHLKPSEGQRHDALCNIIDRPLSTWMIFKAGFDASQKSAAPMSESNEAKK